MYSFNPPLRETCCEKNKDLNIWNYGVDAKLCGIFKMFHVKALMIT